MFRRPIGKARLFAVLAMVALSHLLAAGCWHDHDDDRWHDDDRHWHDHDHDWDDHR